MNIVSWRKVRGAAVVLSCAVLAGIGLALSLSPAQTSADSSIAFHWDFNALSDTEVPDVSGNGNHGILFNSPAYVQGVSGSGLALNGIDQYVRSNAPLASLGARNQPYALSAWVRLPVGEAQGNIIHIASQQNGSGWCIPFLRLQNNQFRATGWQGTNSSNQGPTSAVWDEQVEPNRWYQVLTTWDSDNGLRLFVDGELVDSTPQTTFYAHGSPVYVFLGIGNSWCSEDQGYLNATVDDVRIYNRVIEPEDVEEINNPVEAPLPPDDDDGDDSENGSSTNTATLIDPATNNTVELTVDESCDLIDAAMIGQGEHDQKDDSHRYATSFVRFTVSGCDDDKTDVELQYHAIDREGLVLRKYHDTDGYFTVDSATISPVADSENGVVVTYSVEDNGPLDIDDRIGVMTDPVALAHVISDDADELAATGQPVIWAVGLGVFIVLGSGLLLHRRVVV